MFPAWAVDELKRVLARWQIIYPPEDTLIRERCGVPSLFVRFDCVISPEGQLAIYELQEGCAGIGYAGIANEALRNVRDTIAGDEWPGLKEIRSTREKNQDDDLWLERISFRQGLRHNGPLVVRSALSTCLPHVSAAITRKSVRPIQTHNDKSYGVEFGWWKPVSWESTAHGEALPWNEGFVLKPLKTAGSVDIMPWNPQKRIERTTRAQILRVLQERDTMYLQPFISPMQMDINGTVFNHIYRPYFVYSSREREWIPMHGMWVARPYPNIRIHGASDAIWGPLVAA